MAAFLLVMAVVGVVSFGVTVLVIRWFTVRQLSRNPDPGAAVRVNGKGLTEFLLLLLGVWVCVSAAVIVVVYTTVLPALVIGVLFCLMVLLRPVIQVKGRSAFVIHPEEGTVAKSVAPSVGE